ncbi:MAG: hypothetical protein LUE12_04320 [Ruminococcus sp.]|nr:hypothetical protein [Ruminococcus sp.]
MNTILKTTAVISSAIIISISSLTFSATADAVDTSSVNSGISSVITLGSSFTSKKVTIKSSYSCTTSAIRINWKKVSGANGYRVYRYNSKTKKWVKIKTIFNGSTLTYKNCG